MHMEFLDNGLIRVRDRRSGLCGLWTVDGTPHSGDLTYARNAEVISVSIRDGLAEYRRALQAAPEDDELVTFSNLRMDSQK